MEDKLFKIAESLNRINYKKIIWLLAISETFHNMEEAIRLPLWTQTLKVRHPQVSAFEFRFAVILLTLLIYWIIYYFSKHENKFAEYSMAGVLTAILFNVFVPHLAGTIIAADFVPGVITGVLMNVPVCLYLILRGLKEGIYSVKSLAAGGIIFTIITMPALPVVFAMGKFVESFF